MTVAPSREYLSWLSVGAVAGAGVAVSASQAWARAQSRTPGLPSRVVSVDGADVAPLAAAAGWVILAGVVAVVATRGIVRRLCGALVALSGAGVAVLVLTVGTDLATAVNGPAIGRPVEVGTGSWWRWLCLGCALLACAFGISVSLRGHRWPEMGAQYETPAAPKRSGDAQADLWRALDRGEDPTTPPRPRRGGPAQ